MSSIVDVYLHGSVHLTNPGSEELFIGILARGLHTAVVAPEGPGGFGWLAYGVHGGGMPCCARMLQRSIIGDCSQTHI